MPAFAFNLGLYRLKNKPFFHNLRNKISYSDPRLQATGTLDEIGGYPETLTNPAA